MLSYVCIEKIVYLELYYLQFQASAEGLKMYPPWKGGDYCILSIFSDLTESSIVFLKGIQFCFPRCLEFCGLICTFPSLITGPFMSSCLHNYTE